MFYSLKADQLLYFKLFFIKCASVLQHIVLLKNLEDLRSNNIFEQVLICNSTEFFWLDGSFWVEEVTQFQVKKITQFQDTHNQAGIAHNGGLVPLLKLLDSKNGSLQHNAAFSLYGLADNEVLE